MNRPAIFACLSSVVLLTIGCGPGDEVGSSTLEASWTFESGDCASNGIETVKVSATKEGGDALEGEFACADGSGEIGEIDESGGTYAIAAEGLDADGVVRAENFGQSSTFPDGRTLGPVEITLRPKSANVVVSWNGCPSGVVIPFYVALYNPPAEEGGELTDKVTEVQETCSSAEATLERVTPGDYVVEVDSRAVTPAVRGTTPVTVVPGEDAEASVDVP